MILSKCTGLINVSLSQSANANLVQIELNIPSTISIFPCLDSSMIKMDENVYRFERSLSSQICSIDLCRYEVKDSSPLAPIELKPRLNLYERDKLAELTINLKTNFEKPFRATHVKVLLSIFFRLTRLFR